MKNNTWFIITFLLIMSLGITTLSNAAETNSVLEKSMSDTLDTWREGRFEQLFEQLAHRGKTSRESFVEKMHDTTIRPSCCWKKIEHFKVLNEKLTEATVYVKIGLDGTPDSTASITREFKLTHQEGVWKMQLADVLSIAGATGKKKNTAKHHSKKHSPYPY